MLRRQRVGKTLAALAVFMLLCGPALGLAGPQGKIKDQPPADETKKDQGKAAPRPPAQGAEKRAAQIAKMVADYDLKPHPLPAIPDDPPPHRP